MLLLIKMFCYQATNNCMLYHKTVFSCFLILVSIQFLYGAPSILPQLITNTQVVNLSYYEYILDHSTNMNSFQNGEGKAMMLNAAGAKPNLTALTWAHAVNSQQLLTEALNSNIDFIEADIVMGKLNNSGPDIPVMAHPPANNSDISLDSFLLQIKGYNDIHAEEMKGVKLDFKSIEVFEGALDTLKQKIPEMTYPIWLNADIISGPVNQTSTTPVDPERFFNGCSHFQKAVLSIGWTTKWSTDSNNGSYTPKEIDAMVVAIKSSNVTESGHAITFPVRAGIAANSLNELHHLVRAVNDTNESTLTIWSSQNDYVDVDKLRKLIFSFGFDRVYLDVPEDLSSQLNLSRVDNENGDGNGGCAALLSLVNFSLMSIGMVLISLWLQKVHL